MSRSIAREKIMHHTRLSERKNHAVHKQPGQVSQARLLYTHRRRVCYVANFIFFSITK